MGDWTVLKRWAVDYLDSRATDRDGTHPVSVWCNHPVNTGVCFHVVEEHQNPEPEVTAPKFTVSVAYQRGEEYSELTSRQPGWHWSISWIGRKGTRKFNTGYGFETPAAAKRAAEAQADKIALSELPEEVYAYTPKMEH